MTDELKPVRCGCGGEAIISSWRDQAYVYCKVCGMRTDVYSHAFCAEKAVTAWNRAMGGDQFREVTKKIERTAKVETVEKPNVFKCGECGQYFHQTAWGSNVEYCSRCGAKLDWSGNE